MGVGDVTGMVVRPAISGGMRARKAKSRQDHVTKKQIAAFVLVSVGTTILARTLNDLIERHLGE
jgi:hypothetical protein